MRPYGRFLFYVIYFVVINLLGNFILFTPMGVLLPCVAPKLNLFWRVTLTVLTLVVAVEITQGILRVGSIFFNVIGAIIGYGMIKIPFVFKFFKKINLIKKKDSVPEKE